MQESSNHRVVVDALAKIGGKYLGKLVLPTIIKQAKQKDTKSNNMARKLGAVVVIGQACLCHNYLWPRYKHLWPHEPQNEEPVWRVVRGVRSVRGPWAYQTLWVHQLSKPGNLIGPNRQVLFECSLGDNDYDKGLLCYIPSQPVDEDTFALALDHIEAEASKKKPTKLVFDFEDDDRNHRKQLKKRGYAVDVLDPRNEWSRFVLGKHLA